LFLIYFPIALLINAGFARWGGTAPAIHLGGLIGAWVCCNVAAAAFYHLVEQRTHTWPERLTRPPVRGAVPSG